MNGGLDEASWEDPDQFGDGENPNPNTQSGKTAEQEGEQQVEKAQATNE
jgi:hypothetical protein